MKKNYRRSVLSAMAILGAITSIIAQTNYVHQVIILNEGRYDYINLVQVEPVTLGAYDPVAGSYAVFDTIPNARFGSDVLINGNEIYFAVDTLLLVYDKTTLQQVNSAVIPGLRKIAMWNNQLLVTRGSTSKHNSYFQVYDRSTLTLAWELDTLTGPQYSAEGLAVYNDSCYIAINNGFEWGNYKSILGVIDLNAQSYQAEIDFGPDGLNPDNLMIEGDKIYTLNNKNWDVTGSSITIYNTTDRSYQNNNLSASVGGCGTSVSADNYIYYQKYNTTDSMLTFNRSTQQISGFSESIPGFLYGMADDYINGWLYVTATDYATWGKGYIMQYNGTMIDSFDVGLNPGTIALDTRTSTGIDEAKIAGGFSFYPNPAGESVTIDPEEENVLSIQITDVSGRVVYRSLPPNPGQKQVVNLRGWTAGTYFIQVASTDAVYTEKLIRY